jgi:predicted GNAT superfamily acetyltransferase
MIDDAARVRPLTDADVPRLLKLNHAAIPAVNDVDAGEMRALIGAAALAVGVVRNGHPDASAVPGPGPRLGPGPGPGPDSGTDHVLGFVLALAPGADYASENYRWFTARGEERGAGFLYVDRIVVAEGHRGEGLGVVLYDAVFEVARASGVAEVDCEVNVRPPNPGSMAFHTRIGFAELGRQSTKNGTVEVALLARPTLSPSERRS